MATTLTTPTTVCFLARETPPPPLELNLMATTLTTQLPSVFKRDPTPTLEAESDGSQGSWV